MYKEIYSFTVNKKTLKEVTEEVGDTKITKKVESLEPVKIVIRKPSRLDEDNAGEYFARESGNLIRKGLLTRAFVHKLYEKDGYIQSQQVSFDEINAKLAEIGNEYRELSAIESSTEIEDARKQELQREWNDNNKKLQDIQVNIESIYANTAETKAQSKLVSWWITELTSSENPDGSLKPFFRGDTEEQKWKHFYFLSDSEDPHFSEVIQKSTYAISLWFYGKAENKEDFDAFFNVDSEVELEEKPEVESV